jgi:hypothetical protein
LPHTFDGAWLLKLTIIISITDPFSFMTIPSDYDTWPIFSA